MSLISHLVSRYKLSEEDAATEALGYVLDRAQDARNGLRRLLMRAGTELPEGLRFRTQAHGEDKARPDIEGTSGDNEVVVLVEAKFWACLTDNQPVKYLNRLESGRPGILAFMAPLERFHTLWRQILDRCRKDGLLDDSMIDVKKPEFWHLTLKSGHQLALVSWRVVIDEISGSLTPAGKHECANDLEQLRDLCTYVDSPPFVPFSAEELSSNATPRLIMQMQKLGLAIADTAREEMIGIRRDRNDVAKEPEYYGRWLAIGGAGTFVGFEMAGWAELGITPFWVRFYGADQAGVKLAQNRLKMWRDRTPPGYFEIQGEPYIPLRVPAGKEEAEVIDEVMKQLLEIKERLTLNPSEPVS